MENKFRNLASEPTIHSISCKRHVYRNIEDIIDDNDETAMRQRFFNRWHASVDSVGSALGS